MSKSWRENKDGFSNRNKGKRHRRKRGATEEDLLAQGKSVKNQPNERNKFRGTNQHS